MAQTSTSANSSFGASTPVVGPPPQTARPAGSNVAPNKPPKRVGETSGSSAAARIPKRELLSLTSQMAIMTRTGVDVASCLQSLARQARRPAARAMLEQIHEDVLAGNTLSESMRRYVRVFGEMFVASVAAGEASGRLPEVLNHLVRLQRSEIRLHSTLRTVLAYPVLLAAVSLLVVSGLVLFVLPNFAEIFDQYELPLPAITRALLAVSDELRGRIWLWGGLAALAAVGLAALRQSDAGKRLWDRFVLQMLLVRNVTRALLIGRTCRLLGLLLNSGVPLLESLRLARSAIRNSLYRDLFAALEVDVMNGRGMADGLMQAEFVPAAAAEMVVTAERTGSLGDVTELIGQHYEEEGEAKLRELVAVLEPLMIVAMGVVVAVIVLSVMLPMFDISSIAQKGS